MEASWDFYLARMGELQAFVFVDSSLAASPARTSHPDVVLCSIPVKSLRENKLPSEEANDIISRFEDVAKELAEGGGEAIYAGRLSVGHAVTFHYYTGNGAPLAAKFNTSAELKAASDFRCEWEADPQWRYYFDFLYPQAETRNHIENEKVREVMRRSGDDGTAIRDIDHYAYFSSEFSAQLFANTVIERGYQIVRQPGSPEDNGTWLVLFMKPAKPAELDEITWELNQLAEKSGGSYDGWECGVVRPTAK